MMTKDEFLESWCPAMATTEYGRHLNSEFIADLDELLKEKEKWTSVEEDLPEHDTYVLAVSTFWKDPYKVHVALHDDVPHWDGRNSEKHYLRKTLCVTHWMRLPPPPSPKEREGITDADIAESDFSNHPQER